MKDLLNQLAEHLYYVNLKSSVDKRLHCEEVFTKYGLDVERVDAINSDGFETTGKMLDTYKAQNQSFKNVFLDAIDKGYDKIIVFEDDVMFTDDAEKVLEDSLTHLPDDWSCFTFGCLANVYPSVLIGGRVYYIRHAVLGHAWAFKKCMFEPMVKELDEMIIPYDLCITKVFSKDYNKRCYGILNSGIAYQKPGRSDNLKKDYLDNSRID